VAAYFSQHLHDFFGVFRADFAAFQHLLADRIQAHQQHTAAFLTGPVDVQDVTAAIVHVASQELAALSMNGLHVSHKLLGQLADGAER
jgi:hypothetical protein